MCTEKNGTNRTLKDIDIVCTCIVLGRKIEKGEERQYDNCNSCYKNQSPREEKSLLNVLNEKDKGRVKKE